MQEHTRSISVKLESSTLNSAQIRWQCRRGMLELDLILLEYFDNCYAQLTLEQQCRFSELLQQTDHTLYQCLVAQLIPMDFPSKLCAVIKHIHEKTVGWRKG